LANSCQKFTRLITLNKKTGSDMPHLGQIPGVFSGRPEDAVVLFLPFQFHREIAFAATMLHTPTEARRFHRLAVMDFCK
jgi:hypothetical protein